MKTEDRVKTEAEVVRDNQNRVRLNGIAGSIAAAFTLIWSVGLFALITITFIAVTGVTNVPAMVFFGTGISVLVALLIGSVFWLIQGTIEDAVKHNNFVSSKNMLTICNKVAPYADLKSELNHYLAVRPYLTVTEYHYFSKEIRKLKKDAGDNAYQQLWEKQHLCDMGGSVA